MRRERVKVSSHAHCFFLMRRERVKVAELEWGKPGYVEAAPSLIQELGPIDWVLAADCLYIDNVCLLLCSYLPACVFFTASCPPCALTAILKVFGHQNVTADPTFPQRGHDCAQHPFSLCSFAGRKNAKRSSLHAHVLYTVWQQLQDQVLGVL